LELKPAAAKSHSPPAPAAPAPPRGCFPVFFARRAARSWRPPARRCSRACSPAGGETQSQVADRLCKTPNQAGLMGSSCAAGPGTAVKLLWPEKIWRFRPIQANLVSETGTGRAPAGTTKSFPTALTPRSLDALERKKRQRRKAPRRTCASALSAAAAASSARFVAACHPPTGVKHQPTTAC
jgi:hypothetical protein